MAEKSITQEVLEKVESDLNCGICLETYTEPKALPCFHAFCTKCLRDLIEGSQERQSISCPKCRQRVPLTSDGVDGLQTAFYVHRLLDIRDVITKSLETEGAQCERCEESTATGYCKDCCQFVCNGCKEIHRLWKKDFGLHTILTMKEVETQAVNLAPIKKKECFCAKHPQEQVKIFCETCQVLACSYCSLRHHQAHQHDLIDDAFQRGTSEIREQLLPAKQQRKQLQLALEDFETRAAEIAVNKENIGDKIHEKISCLCELLKKREAELLKQLEQMARQKQERLTAQRESIEALLVQLSNSIDYTEASLRTNSREEVLSLKATTLQQLSLLADDFQEDRTRPKEGATLQLQITDLEDTCKELGVVVNDRDIVTCDKCSLITSGDVFVTAEEGKLLTMKITSATGESLIISDPTAVVAKLIDKNREPTLCKVFLHTTGHQIGECCIECVPKLHGKYKLHVTVEGRHVQHSPLSVTALPALTCFQNPLQTISGVRGPCGLGFKSVRLIVAETDDNYICEIKPNGERGGVWSRSGCAGVATENNKQYYTDMKNHCIRTGSSFVGSKGSAELQFDSPAGIAFNRHDNNIYVCDTNNHRIQVLTEELEFVKMITSEGSETVHQLQSPEDIAFDSDGLLYIADSGNNCIQVYTAGGRFSHSFGSERLKSPHGLTVDNTGKVYVVEYTAHRLSIFTCNGVFIRSFELPGLYPQKIVRHDMNFYISCYGSNCILKY